MNYQEVCYNFLNEIFRKYECTIIKDKDIAHTLLNILIGTQGTTRLGAMPSEETKKEILRRIQFKIEQNKPLEVSCSWGALKTIPAENRNVDLAEILTLRQFHSICEAVQSVYEPGIRFNIYLGDSYYIYLYGDDDRINVYCKAMEKLAIKYPEINIVYLSEQCNKKGNVMQQCERNYHLLHDYWMDTNDISLEKYNQVPSAIRLYESGWIGDITPAMRNFHLKRMSSLYPEEGHEFWTEKIIRFFAYGFMLRKSDLMNRQSEETSTVDSCLLRVPPPDFPRKLYSNRIRMRIAPDTVIKTSAPPWTVAGTIIVDINNNLHMRLLDATTYKNTEIEEVDFDDTVFRIYQEGK
ncbi:MAG: L-tyrosine/L-tryptophan isonitrile synthase family protein [Anaeroplasmataceae bacterium]|nr:L-tyrosine/L-tryptophan isonitrile synthase family protein [Anaeroplasmataceae bacterium]